MDFYSELQLLLVNIIVACFLPRAQFDRHILNDAFGRKRETPVLGEIFGYNGQCLVWGSSIPDNRLIYPSKSQ